MEENEKINVDTNYFFNDLFFYISLDNPDYNSLDREHSCYTQFIFFITWWTIGRLSNEILIKERKKERKWNYLLS